MGEPADGRGFFFFDVLPKTLSGMVRVVERWLWIGTSFKRRGRFVRRTASAPFASLNSAEAPHTRRTTAIRTLPLMMKVIAIPRV